MFKTVSVAPRATHTASVIFLHGLGDSGYGWQPVGEMLSASFPNVRWIFPHAPNRPVTLNYGMSMPAWFDIFELNDKSKEDEEGLLSTVKQVSDFVQSEIDKGIPSDRIVLGGFSQGAAISLLFGLHSNIKVGGLVGLSGFLPLASKANELKTTTNLNTPIFMGHGTEDPVVLYPWGRSSAEKLKDLGFKDLEFKSYGGLQHSASNEELADLVVFLKRVFDAPN